MTGFSASASLRYSSVNRVEIRCRYFRYARRMPTCSHVSPPATTRRFNESDSA